MLFQKINMISLKLIIYRINKYKSNRIHLFDMQVLVVFSIIYNNPIQCKKKREEKHIYINIYRVVGI